VSREGLRFVAVGAAACAGCCAVPILGALGITVGAAAAAWFAFGLLAAGAVLAVGLSVIRHRRRAPA
jgi:hypothetical protein